MFLLETLVKDCRYAIRLLWKSPIFTVAVTLSLALGIGANTAIFSLINAVMWRTLPVKDPEGLVLLIHSRGSTFTGGFTYQQYRIMRQQPGGFSQLAAWSSARLNVSVDGNLEPTTDGQLVSGNYFSLLGISPIAGRTIGAEDDVMPNGHPVAMISYGYWKRRFGLSPAVIGRDISISGTRFAIIGVTPPEFFGLEVGSSPDLFLPVLMQPTAMPDLENLLDQPIIYRTWLQVVGRLAAGATPAQAVSQLEPIYNQEVPTANKFGGPPLPPERLRVEPAATGISDLRRQFSQPLFILMGLVGMVLLIACANTANLLLARAAARRGEFGVRLALGAGRRRLIRQLLVESVILALAGGFCGILLAVMATRLLVAYMSAGQTPIALELTPDLRVLTFTGAVSVLTGILFGLTPAMRATRIDLTPSLKTVGRSVRGSLRSGKILCVVQVALSLILLIGAGLFVRSLQKLNGQDTGVDRDRVLIVRVEPRGSDQRNIPGTTPRLDRTYRDLLTRVASIGGVRACSLAQFTPMTLRGNNVPFTLPSGAEQRATVPMIYPNFFATVGIGLVAGRDFNDSDLRPQSPLVAVVNETFARQAFNGAPAVGQQLRQRNDLIEIVGVVRDSHYTSVREETPPTVYQTFLQTRTGRGQMALYVRTDASAATVFSQVRQAVQDVDRDLPLFAIHTLSEEMGAVLIRDRLIATLSSVFGALALVLACVGLYGLLSFSVVQRRAEMGIRIALGANRGDVAWTVMREALVLVGGGVIIGIPLALALGRLASNRISGLLFGLDATDPLTIAAATTLLALIAAAAGYMPARRASRVDPMVALRNE
ncbi:MAG TPA: ABC transporter permease [Vicinamibacterales bacterium]|nr:ABC transporter permease [Vicinamibacterales bacterium]